MLAQHLANGKLASGKFIHIKYPYISNVGYKNQVINPQPINHYYIVGEKYC